MATSVVFPRVQFFANNGRPLIGGRIHTYVAGSSTRARTYKDAAKAQPNTNPIILDGRGEAAIYLAEGVEYKFVVEDSKGALILTQEPVYGAIWPNTETWPSDATLAYQFMTEAKAAAAAIGPIEFYDTFAQAQGDLTNLGDKDVVEVAADEDHDGARTRYQVADGALVFVVNLDQLRMDLTQPTGAEAAGGFESYAKLRAYTGPATRVTITGVLGTKNSGIYGIFERNPSDTSSADNGGTVIVDARGRRWRRRFDGSIDASWFGVVGDDLTDCTAALVAALAQLKSRKHVTLPAGVIRFSEKSALPLQSYIKLSGQGMGLTQLLYTGTEKTGDLLTYGDGVKSLRDSHIEGFTIDSVEPMTAGAALRVRRVQNGSGIYQVGCGTVAGVATLWNGVHFDGTHVTRYNGFSIYVQNEGVVINGNASNDEGSDLWLDNGFILGGKNLIHVGGGFGGVYLGKVLAYGGSGCSVLIDEALAARSNREIFLSDECVLDGANTALLKINNPSGPLIVECDAFLSGAGYFAATPGDNIVVESMPNGRLAIGSGTIKSAKRRGIVIHDASTLVTISDKTMVTDCGDWGLWSSVTTSNVVNNGTFKWNASGNIHQNILDYSVYSSSVVSTIGAVNSANCNMRYRKTGNFVHIEGYVGVTDNGDGDGALIVFLPFPMLHDCVGSGACITNGKMVYVRGEAANTYGCSVQNYDGTYPGYNGMQIRFSISYFAKS